MFKDLEINFQYRRSQPISTKALNVRQLFYLSFKLTVRKLKRFLFRSFCPYESRRMWCEVDQWQIYTPNSQTEGKDERMKNKVVDVRADEETEQKRKTKILLQMCAAGWLIGWLRSCDRRNKGKTEQHAGVQMRK